MRGDRDPHVRTAAVVASRARALGEYLPVYSEVLADEKEPAVRRAIVEVLAGARTEAGGARALLEQVSTSDPDADVRDLARRALAPTEAGRE
jgi:HEAT repeat protein